MLRLRACWLLHLVQLEIEFREHVWQRPIPAVTDVIPVHRSSELFKRKENESRRCNSYANTV